MGYPPFYEGAEKLLEISFAVGKENSKNEAKPSDLRAIPRAELDGLLAAIGAEIISDMSTHETHAYVLSESSMFITQHGIILKTCGMTKLINAVPLLLKLVQRYTSLGEIEELYYSRKEFLRPDLQDPLHQSFSYEVKQLDVDFDGTAHYFGDADRRWYVYVFDAVNKPKTDKSKAKYKSQPEDCLEIMMELLDPQVMAIFTKAHSSSALDATQKSGIDTILPGLAIDDFLFDPCGYSMNGLMPDGRYATIHITPEPAYSYVSFETNALNIPQGEIIRRVLDVFKPEKFICTTYKDTVGNDVTAKDMLEEKKAIDRCPFEGFKLMDLETVSLRCHRLSYMAFVQDIT